MFTRSLPIMLAAGLLSLLAIRNAPADPDVPPVPPPQTDGIDVQARGPVHEAFAQPVDGQPRPSPVVAKEPPAPIDEAPPDQKPDGDNVQWIPGYWQYDDDRADFLWVSGFWRTPPPGRQWTPGHWDRVDGGWQRVGGSWVPTEQEQVTYLPPPPATIDVGPSTPPPDADSTYVPGCWVYRETRYRWRPGYFIASRPNFCWTPAHYDWTPAGCTFTSGYWDYPLAQRGLLFAPVTFDAQLLQQPDFVYTPQYVVSSDFLPTALFVGPSCHDYYFGDYFGDRDERRGFQPWGDYRIGRYSHDPLFNYYRTTYADRGWERGIRDLYAAQYNGDAARPPHTLEQQNTRFNNINQVSVLSPLAQARTTAPLVTIPASAQVAQRRNASKLWELSARQRQTQQEIVVARKAPLQIGDPPRVVKAPRPTRTGTPTIRDKAPLPASPAPRPTSPRELKPTAPPPPLPPLPPGRREVAPPAHPKAPKTPTPTQLAPPVPVHPKEQTPPPVPVHPKLPPPPPQRTAPPQRIAPPPPTQRVAPPPTPQRTAPSPPPQRSAPPSPPPQRSAPPSPPPQRSAPPPQKVAPPPPPPQRTPPPPAPAHPKK